MNPIQISFHPSGGVEISYTEDHESTSVANIVRTMFIDPDMPRELTVMIDDLSDDLAALIGEAQKFMHNPPRRLRVPEEDE